VRLKREPVAVETDGDRVRAVALHNLEAGEAETICADYVLDATELGDLLPLAGVEYVSGAESQDEIGEPHALSGPPQPDNVQSITWCFPMAYDPGVDVGGRYADRKAGPVRALARVCAVAYPALDGQADSTGRTSTPSPSNHGRASYSRKRPRIPTTRCGSIGG